MTFRKKRRNIMYAFATTIIAGIFSMAFSKKILEPTKAATPISSFYDIKLKDINGSSINLAEYKGKKVMIVNVASRCGYTSQYAGLQNLYESYSTNLEIIAIPCNDFGSQESGTNKEIKSFCETNFGVTFTMGEKQNIKSTPQSELYSWLSSPQLNGWNKTLPSWNFCKYIINEEGNLTHFLRSSVRPDGKEIMEIIQS
tara:strand:- start:824 stop:1420 length:597 start_codon:yes stop_codon:yes gene_type:complete